MDITSTTESTTVPQAWVDRANLGDPVVPNFDLRTEKGLDSVTGEMVG
jgi:hypothetical protein